MCGFLAISHLAIVSAGLEFCAQGPRGEVAGRLKRKESGIDAQPLKERETSVVPPGLEFFFPPFPALKRWAKFGRPSGTRLSRVLIPVAAGHGSASIPPDDARRATWRKEPVQPGSKSQSCRKCAKDLS